VFPDRTDIRLALPSKGRIADDALNFMADAGLRVYKPNPRQLTADIPSMPRLTVLFQRAGDIAVSVRDGSVDFGITSWDLVCERGGGDDSLLPLHRALGFSSCTLHVIVPQGWDRIHTMADLLALRAELGRPLRVATKFHNLTAAFLAQHSLGDSQLIDAEGTLEIAPLIGYADLIADLVSTGTTLRDNQMRTIDDGLILESQACLVANRRTLKTRPEVKAMAKLLLEYIEAHLRAVGALSIFANLRGESPEAVASRMFAQSVIGGLQGPTISPIITREGGGWYGVHIIVRRDQLTTAIAELRAVGGSGVIVTPVTYIFEEEPAAYRAMLAALEEG
jgi:ATP phosphoribosyltransferase